MTRLPVPCGGNNQPACEPIECIVHRDGKAYAIIGGVEYALAAEQPVTEPENAETEA